MINKYYGKNKSKEIANSQINKNNNQKNQTIIIVMAINWYYQKYKKII